MLAETYDNDLFKDPEIFKRFIGIRRIGAKGREQIDFCPIYFAQQISSCDRRVKKHRNVSVIAQLMRREF